MGLRAKNMYVKKSLTGLCLDLSGLSLSDVLWDLGLRRGESISEPMESYTPPGVAGRAPRF